MALFLISVEDSPFVFVDFAAFSFWICVFGFLLRDFGSILVFVVAEDCRFWILLNLDSYVSETSINFVAGRIFEFLLLKISMRMKVFELFVPLNPIEDEVYC